MEDQVWYVYENDAQQGPFALEQIQKMFSSNMITQVAYVFKTGWKDWRPIEECYEELELGLKDQPATESRRKAAPRASVTGRVVIHNNDQLTIGTGVNISFSGIFVETADEIFKVGEKIKLSVKAQGMNKAFNTEAEVIRYNTDDRYAIGYGLKFLELNAAIASEIKALVEKHRQDSDDDASTAVR